MGLTCKTQHTAIAEDDKIIFEALNEHVWQPIMPRGVVRCMSGRVLTSNAQTCLDRTNTCLDQLR
jgi:hypothetical protein